MIKLFSEFYSFRFFLYMITIRDLKLRYKQTVLGVIWVVLQPLLPLAIFTCVFGKVVKIDSQGIPYPLLAFSGLAPWLLFSESINRCANSLVAEERLLTRVYFPKLILPLSKFITVFFDFLITLAIFFIFLFAYDFPLTSRFFVLPLVLLVVSCLSIGLGIIVSALNVYFRDFRIIVPFLLQTGMYASPVVYSAFMVPAKYQLIFFMNPMVGVIESFRWVFFNNITAFPTIPFLIAVSGSVIFFTLALLVFRRVEMYFADVI